MENSTTDSITINNVFYDAKNLSILCQEKLASAETLAYEKPIYSFLQDWINPEITTFTVFTSGSTGIPKAIKITKTQMIASANQTGNYFSLKKNDTALLCLPAEKIAGKMMLVRSLVLGLNLFVFEKIKDIPLTLKNPIKFAAFTPMQLSQIFLFGQQYAHSFFKQFSAIIVGGSEVNYALKQQILGIKSAQIYQTFGMTETVSHVALKPLNNLKSNGYEYELLPNIDAGIDERGCIWIAGAVTNDQKIFSNDLVRFSGEKTFEWMGRTDNVVNSGGIKILTEMLQEKLSEIIFCNPEIFADLVGKKYFFAGVPHPIFGEALVLVLEADFVNEAKTIDSLKPFLDKYEVPKKIICTQPFDVLANDKIDKRQVLKKLSNFTF